MPIDWDKFQSDIGGLVDDAGEKTDAKLASRISSVTRLTDDEVKKLAELMEIVKKAGDRNEKINKIVSNIEEFGGIVVTLLGKLA